MIYFTTFFLALFVTISLTPLLRRLALKVHALDYPDARKVHTEPIPKCGGIAMAFGALVPFAFWRNGDAFSHALLLGTAIVVVFGLVDDFKDLGFKAKFAGQIAAALVVILYGGVRIDTVGALLPVNWVIPEFLSIPLTVIVIVGITNAINLSDGLDGLAGGISFLSFACIGYLAFTVENIVIVAFSIAAIGAIFGFLRFNTFPASLFMGDAGSQFLGFLAITLSLKLTQSEHPFSTLLPLLVLGFPILDTLTVMIERLYKGVSPFVADKNHFHHRLMRLGLVHKEAVFVIYVLQSVFVLAAYFFRFIDEWLLVLLYVVFSVAIFGGFFAAGKRRWRMKRYAFLDVFLHGKLSALKEKNILIRVAFRTLETTLPVLLLIACLMAKEAPVHVALFSFLLFGLLALFHFWKPSYQDGMLRFALFLVTPYAIYLSEVSNPAWVSSFLDLIYDLCFGLIALSIILTLKFTRRQKGFKTTPLDFLVLFTAIVLPYLFGPQSKLIGVISVKVIVLFFGYEVLIDELRGEIKVVTMATMIILGVFGIRALL
jgi:UDP-GlcNAc:undecaprenyl-phosphate/decaprenyl-phosphate GlcNAc-1-phosphate transferase